MPVARCGARLWSTLLVALCCALGHACTPIHSRNNELGALSVSVDADPEVRAELDDVEVVVESQTTDPNSWTVETSKRFTPDPSAGTGWPLAFRLDSYDAEAVYQVRVTSRDQAGAIVSQARLIADPKRRQTRELELHLDRECLHRNALCSRSQTCSLGECIDAHESPKLRAAADSGSPSQAPGTDQLVQSSRASDACSSEGAHSCAMTTGEPLRCTEGMWQPEPACPDALRCDSTIGETFGTCQPVAAECKSRKPGDRYCDADGTMLVCKDDQRSIVSPCGENEHCLELAGEVQCGCSPGFVQGAQGCQERVDCKDQGGCDPLTMCEMQNGSPVCTACPPGFGGKGETGCLPLLTGLQVSPRPLDKSFSPSTTQYKVRLPLFERAITITATTDAAAQLSIADTIVASGETWTSPPLAQAQTTIAVTLKSAKGPRNDYQIVVEHDAPQETYIKSVTGVSGGNFGRWTAAYGDTIVLTAPYESALGSDGAEVANAGAAHVFVRNGAGWELQQTLHSSKPYRDDAFGSSVAIWEDRIAIGSLGHDIFTALGTGTRDGSVEIFTRSTSRWQLQERLGASDAAMSGNAFGIALALHADTLVVGAPLEDTGGTRSGEIYIFTWTGAKWDEQQHMKAPSPSAEARFGSSFGMTEDLIAVGAPWEDVGSNIRAGAVYMYQRSGNAWVLLERLESPKVRATAQFGYGLALKGQTLAVGAPYTPVASDAAHSGEVYLFAHNGAALVPDRVLEARYPRAGDLFGYSVALSTSSMAVGAMGESGTLEDPAGVRLSGSGAAFLYNRAENGPVLANYLKASNAAADDGFGCSVALTDRYVVVSAAQEDGSGQGVGANPADGLTDSGAVYVVQ